MEEKNELFQNLQSVRNCVFRGKLRNFWDILVIKQFKIMKKPIESGS